MAAPLGSIDVVCDAPPYEVVRACERVGLLRTPLDVAWHHRARYIADRGRQAGLFSLATWKRLLGLGKPERPCCGCGRAVPSLRRFTFEFASGRTIDYRLGQCIRCRAVFWEGPG